MTSRQVSNAGAGWGRAALAELAVNGSHLAVFVTDAEMRLIFVNDTFGRMLGHASADVLGRPVVEVIGDDYSTRERQQHIWQELRQGRSVKEEVRTRDVAGRELWLIGSVRAILDAEGRIEHLIGMLESTTETRRVQALQRDVLRAVAEEMPLAEVMQLICERVQSIFPEVTASVVAVDGARRLRPLAGPSLSAAYAEALDGLEIGPLHGSCGTCAWSGVAVSVEDIASDPRWANYRHLPLGLGLVACWSSPIRLGDGRVAGTFAFYFRDRRGPSPWHEQVVNMCLQLCALAFERHESKARIAHLAYCDPLTGLPNRVRLAEQLTEVLAAADGAALLFLDIDHFKDVNDSLGHPVGDQFLQAIAQRLQEQLRPGDLMSRHGGDEFVIVLANADAGRARGVAERLLDAIAEPVQIEGRSLPSSASIGISLYPSDGTDSATLLRNADTAMYRAKSEGRSTYRFFSAAMKAQAEERLVLGAALRETIGKGQLRLAYQPQIDARTGALSGVEALSRWTHPVHGEVAPARFIALAESCGLIEAIGEFSLRESCRQLRRWEAQGIAVPRVAVNLSPLQFRTCGLPEMVRAALAESGLAAGRLVIEITEGVMMDACPAAIDNARMLRQEGVAIAMDDFGTGYSSLSHLARLPVSEIKIDRSFMRHLEEDDAAQALVTAVIRIGESLGLRVVAEGVETVAQRRFLEALGCDVLQGFLFGEAMPPAALAPWLAARETQLRITAA